MTFRLTNLLYLFALVAASLGAFGPSGIWVTGGVIAFWVLLFYLPRPGCVSLFLIVMLLASIVALSYPAVSTPRYIARRAQCMNNLRQLAVALIHAYEIHGQFPPAKGPHGENLDQISWRVLVAHFLDNTIIPANYHYDEPWNSPQNWNLVNVPYELHECPIHGVSTAANYFAIIGPQTIWGEGGVVAFANVTDGTANTVLLIEAAGRGIHWAEPKDLTFDEAMELLTSRLPADDSDGHRLENGYFYKPSYVRYVAMCDGSIHALPVPLPREAAEALLTAGGGEEIDPEWLDYFPKPQLDYGRIWGFSLFVVLALLPGVPRVRRWVWPLTWEERQEATALEQFEAESRTGSKQAGGN